MDADTWINTLNSLFGLIMFAIGIYLPLIFKNKESSDTQPHLIAAQNIGSAYGLLFWGLSGLFLFVSYQLLEYFRNTIPYFILFCLDAVSNSLLFAAAYAIRRADALFAGQQQEHRRADDIIWQDDKGNLMLIAYLTIGLCISGVKV